MSSQPTTVIDHTTEQMILEVINGNPGACTIVCQILASPLWHPILESLNAKGLIGSTLWRIVHDDYNDDWHPLVHQVFKTRRN